MRKLASVLLASLFFSNTIKCFTEPAALSVYAIESITIASASDLLDFAARVNKGEEDLNATLVNNIDLSSVCSESVDWIPIGGSRSSIPDGRSYKGIFDGAGYTITGLQITGGHNNVGLFGTSSGTIKNLCVEANIRSNVNNSNVAAICAHNYGGNIINCSAKGFVQGGVSVGGVCGSNTYASNQSYSTGIIDNCKNYATVTGIIIANQALGSNVGGICGDSALSCGVKNCSNYGAVSGYDDVGGICGEGAEISCCYNNADISGMYQTINGITEITGIKIGGIVGDCRYGFTTQGASAMLISCYNTGSITGASSVGGIAGSSMSAGLINSYNIGDVTGSGSEIGGVVGSNAGTLDNCYYRTGCAKDGSGSMQMGIGNFTQGRATADDNLSTIPINNLSALAASLNKGVEDWIDNEEVAHPILLKNPEAEIPDRPEASTTSISTTLTSPSTSTTMSQNDFENYMKSQFNKWTVGSGIQRNTLTFTDSYECNFIVSISSSRVNAELLVKPDLSGYSLKLNTSKYDLTLPSQVVSIVTAINGVVLDNQFHGAWDTKMVSVPQENPNKHYYTYDTESSDTHLWEIYTETGDQNQQPYYVNCWDESLTTTTTTTTDNTTELTTACNPSSLTGDLNKDGNITVADAIVLCRIIAEDASELYYEDVEYDLDDDGLITILDVRWLLKELL